MTTQYIDKAIKSGYSLRVMLRPDKKYEKMVLQTILLHPHTNVVERVYYKHCQKFLNDDQLKFIDTYNTVKDWTFKNDVDMNVKFRKNIETDIDVRNRVMRMSIKKMQYLEQD